jgi:hypothetical protein
VSLAGGAKTASAPSRAGADSRRRLAGTFSKNGSGAVQRHEAADRIRESGPITGLTSGGVASSERQTHSCGSRIATAWRYTGDLIHKSPAEFIDADSREHLGEPRRGIDLRESACHA